MSDDEADRVTLLWWADPIEPLAAWAVRSTVDVPYILSWGDGTSTPMASSSKPVRHSYNVPGVYPLLAIAVPSVTAEIVVRGSRPHTTFTLGHDGCTVTATLPAVPQPVLYRIDWGDGIVTDHDGADLSPSHTYRSGFGTPKIAVTDVPARWTIRYTGPTIPAAPAVPRTMFQLTGAEHLGDGIIHLTGFPPGVVVETLYSTSKTQTGYTSAEPVTVKPDGAASVPVSLITDAHWDWWRWARLTWTDPDSGEPRQHTQHMRIREWSPDHYGPCEGFQNDFPVTLDWEDDRPYVITATAAPIQAGNYDISWGDGQVTHHTVGDEQRLDVTHNYGANIRAWIHISGPSGSARRCARPLALDYVTKQGPFSYYFYWARDTIDAGGADPYRPVRIHIDDGRWPMISTLTPSHDPRLQCGTLINRGNDAGIYTMHFTAPMTAFEYVLKTDGSSSEDPDDGDLPPFADVWWRFVADTATTGHFTLENPHWSDYGPGWSIYFRSPPDSPPLKITPNMSSLGEGRWKVAGNDPLPGKSSIRIDIYIESPGYPDFYPFEVRTFPLAYPMV